MSPVLLPSMALASGALDVIMIIVSSSTVIDSPPEHGPKRRVRLSLPSVDSSLISALSRMGVVSSNSFSGSCCRRSRAVVSSATRLACPRARYDDSRLKVSYLPSAWWASLVAVAMVCFAAAVIDSSSAVILAMKRL